MEFYDQVWFWQVTTIFTGLVIGIPSLLLMIKSKKQGDKDSSIEKYNNHLKSLVNSIYDVTPTTSNTNRKPYYFDTIERHSNKNRLLQHFRTLKESKNDKLFDKYNELQNTSKKLREKRKQQNKMGESAPRQKLGTEANQLEGKQTSLKEEFGTLFQSFNDEISSIIKSDYGACSECVDYVNDKKMRKKYRKKL